MRHYKEVEEPAKKVKRLSKCICDFCGKESDEEFDDSIGKQGEYEVTTVSMKRGMIWPGSHSYTEYYYDMCADCFDTMLVPFLREKSNKDPEEKEFDW